MRRLWQVIRDELLLIGLTTTRWILVALLYLLRWILGVKA